MSRDLCWPDIGQHLISAPGRRRPVQLRRKHCPRTVREGKQGRCCSLLEHGVLFSLVLVILHQSIVFRCAIFLNTHTHPVLATHMFASYYQCWSIGLFQGLDGNTDPNSIHSGCPVLKGEKWSATKWMRQKMTFWLLLFGFGRYREILFFLYSVQLSFLRWKEHFGKYDK